MLKDMGHTGGVLGRRLEGEGEEVLLVVIQNMEDFHPRLLMPQPNPLGRKLWQGLHLQNLKIPVHLTLLQGLFC